MLLLLLLLRAYAAARAGMHACMHDDELHKIVRADHGCRRTSTRTGPIASDAEAAHHQRTNSALTGGTELKNFGVLLLLLL